jgi:hypothetical protein
MAHRARGARLAAVQLLRLNDDDMVLRCEKVFFGEGGIGQGAHLRGATRAKAGSIWGAILACHASELRQSLVRTHFIDDFCADGWAKIQRYLGPTEGVER